MIQPGNAEGFGYSSPTQMFTPMKSSGPSMSLMSSPTPQAHPMGIAESGSYVNHLQDAGRSESFNNGSSSGNGSSMLEHKAEGQGIKQTVKQVAKRVFGGGAEDAAADAGATALPLLAPAAIAAAGFGLASHFTGHPTQQQPGQTKQSWVNQNISSGQFAPQASAKLHMQQNPNDHEIPHPGR